MTTFLHGVETIEVQIGTRPIRGVRTAVIAIVGTAPIYEAAEADQRVGEPVLIQSERDARRYFGTPTAGFTIPQALRAIFDQGRGSGTVVVVNVFDPAEHKAAVAAAEYTLPADSTIQLLHRGVSSVVVKSADEVTTYVAGEDYLVAASDGLVTRIADGDILAGATLSIAYDRPNPAAVTAGDVIGDVDAGGQRHGLQSLADSYSSYGFAPKLLVAPGYCTQATVTEALTSMATQLRGLALVDAPIGTTIEQALAGRGPGGAINFATSSDRVVLCYPHIQVVDRASGETVLEPLSPRLAGVIAARDQELGYHWSPSNAEIRGVVGLERPISAAVNDINSEANLLNEAGITTVFNAFGSGFRIWGNRTAAWPSVTHPRNIIPVRRTADILHESVELSMLQFIDQPITPALVDSISESVNAFIRTLIGRGALIDGACTFDEGKNPPEEIAAGHLTFDLAFMPPTPAERITFESFIDTSLLRAVAAQGA